MADGDSGVPVQGFETLFGGNDLRPQPTFFDKAGRWFDDPNNRKLLAGLGGAIGARYPALQASSALAGAYIGSKASQKAAGTQSDRTLDWQKQLAGVLTPPGVAGPTGATYNKDGSIDLKGINPPPGEGWQPKPEGGFTSSTGVNPVLPAESTSAPSPTAVDQTIPTTTTPSVSPASPIAGGTPAQRVSRAQQLSNIIPFY